MRKKIAGIMLTCAVTILMTHPVFAAGWQKDNVGWWYQNDDGTYPMKEWKWLDGNGDGTAECYYFNPSGYCVMNAVTPDGYFVNADGAWIVNGVVQTQKNQNRKLTGDEAVEIIYKHNKGSYENGHYHISLETGESDENTAIIWECWPTGFQGKYIVDLNTGECYLQGPYWSPDEPLEEMLELSYWGNLKNLN